MRSENLEDKPWPVFCQNRIGDVYSGIRESKNILSSYLNVHLRAEIVCASSKLSLDAGTAWFLPCVAFGRRFKVSVIASSTDQEISTATGIQLSNVHLTWWACEERGVSLWCIRRWISSLKRKAVSPCRKLLLTPVFMWGTERGGRHVGNAHWAYLEVRRQLVLVKLAHSSFCTYLTSLRAQHVVLQSYIWQEKPVSEVIAFQSLLSSILTMCSRCVSGFSPFRYLRLSRFWMSHNHVANSDMSELLSRSRAVFFFMVPIDYVVSNAFILAL